MKSLLMILIAIFLMGIAGCENSPVIVAKVEEPPIVQDANQALINFACRMVESNAYQISEIISFSNDFKVTQEDFRSYLVSGECTFINMYGTVKVGKFICGIRIYSDHGLFDEFGAYIFEFSIES